MHGYKLVCRLRTTEQAVPGKDRPTCARCGKVLRMENELLYLGTENPTEKFPDGPGELPRWKQSSGSKVKYRIVLGFYYSGGWGETKETGEYYAHVWTGKFKGYPNTQDRPTFCTQECAARFGLAAYRADYRIVKKEGG